MGRGRLACEGTDPPFCTLLRCTRVRTHTHWHDSVSHPSALWRGPWGLRTVRSGLEPDQQAVQPQCPAGKAAATWASAPVPLPLREHPQFLPNSTNSSNPLPTLSLPKACTPTPPLQCHPDRFPLHASNAAVCEATLSLCVLARRSGLPRLSDCCPSGPTCCGDHGRPPRMVQPQTEGGAGDHLESLGALLSTAPSGGKPTGLSVDTREKHHASLKMQAGSHDHAPPPPTPPGQPPPPPPRRVQPFKQHDWDCPSHHLSQFLKQKYLNSGFGELILPPPPPRGTLECA